MISKSSRELDTETAESKVVEDEQIESAELCHQIPVAPVGSSEGETLDEIRGAYIAHRVLTPYRLHPKRTAKVALTNPGGPGDDEAMCSVQE